MSLTVTDHEVDKAVTGHSFAANEAMALIGRSLPLAAQFVSKSVAGIRMKQVGFMEFGSSDPETMKQTAKLFASDALRNAFQKALSEVVGCDVKAGFQLCCKVGIAVVGNAEAERRLTIFTSLESQVLAQRPELVDC